MVINQTDISKFSLPEAISNPNGKTSGSKLAGLEIVTTGCVCLLMASIEIVAGGNDGIALAGIMAGVLTVGATLLGYSKSQDSNDTTNMEILEKA
jgi:putative N-acetylmannosamine-6-phosphate epimerase